MIDAFSILFSIIICVIGLIGSLWSSEEAMWDRRSSFVALLFFCAFAIAAFCTSDMFLLFIFLEASSVPLYVLMSQGEQSSDAVFHFLLYAMVSALLVLVALVLIYAETGTSSLPEVCRIGVKNKWAFGLLALGIAIKIPVFPFYSWLPIAHVKTKTVCSVLLASVVLKFSSLLLLRLVAPLFMEVILEQQEFIATMITASAVLATLQLVRQTDLKRAFAYFSIIHMNLLFLIFLSGVDQRYFIFSLMYHSVLMAILFFTSDLVTRSYGTREIPELKQMKIEHQGLRDVILLAFLSLVSVPCSWGFASEILTAKAAVEISGVCAVAVIAVMLASSAYAVHIYAACFARWGASENAGCHSGGAVNRYILLSLWVAVFAVGICPDVILRWF